MANELPPRTLDTMSDAIALSSPSGRMSKRARAAALRRLQVALFGDAPLKGEREPQKQSIGLRRHAARLRDLAARGMSVRAFTREADKADAEAIDLESRGL